MEWSEADATRLERPERKALLDPARILSLLGPLGGRRIADVGAGSGMHAFPLARAVGSSGIVYAIDISESLIRILGKRAMREGLVNLKPLLSTPKRIPLPDDAVEIAVSVSCFHDYAKGTLAEIGRILTTNGHFFVVDWDPTKDGKGIPGPPARIRKEEKRVIAECAAFGLTIEDSGRLNEQLYWIRFRNHAC